MQTAPAINRIILYVKDVPKVAAFYQRHFGMSVLPGATDRWLQLETPGATCSIALHKAAVSQKSGAAMKIVFGVADVVAFKQAKAAEGLEFGPVHSAPGYEYANAKDPAGNSISISSRGFQTTQTTSPD